MADHRYDRYISLQPGTDVVLCADRVIEGHGHIEKMVLTDPTGLPRHQVEASEDTPPPLILQPEPGLYRLHITSGPEIGKRWGLSTWAIAVPPTGRPILLGLDQYEAMERVLYFFDHDEDRHPPWQTLLGELLDGTYDRYLADLEATARAVVIAFS